MCITVMFVHVDCICVFREFDICINVYLSLYIYIVLCRAHWVAARTPSGLLAKCGQCGRMRQSHCLKKDAGIADAPLFG